MPERGGQRERGSNGGRPFSLLFPLPLPLLRTPGTAASNVPVMSLPPLPGGPLHPCTPMHIINLYELAF